MLSDPFFSPKRKHPRKRLNKLDQNREVAVKFKLKVVQYENIFHSSHEIL